MLPFENPALKAFVAEIKTELLFAQILVRRSGKGFELRHASDATKPAEILRPVLETELRAISQFTETGSFRPLKSAPDLRDGWRYEALTENALEFALNTFYPGAIADWFAARAPRPPVTSYREFAQRQSGMYRVTAKLSDEQVAFVIGACCSRKLCLKQRLWSVDGLAPDSSGEKSLIPCLEPCAILLEFARKTTRLQPPTPNL